MGQRAPRPAFLRRPVFLTREHDHAGGGHLDETRLAQAAGGAFARVGIAGRQTATLGGASFQAVRRSRKPRAAGRPSGSLAAGHGAGAGSRGNESGKKIIAPTIKAGYSHATDRGRPGRVVRWAAK